MALDVVEIVPLRTSTATETVSSTTAGTLLRGASQYWLDAHFTLIVTAAASTAADTFDLTIQHSHNQDDPHAACWDEFVAFTQVVGNGGAVQHLAQWTRAVSPETEIRTPNTSLAAGNVVQGPIGPDLRVVVTITDDSGSASFSWKLLASVMHTK